MAETAASRIIAKFGGQSSLARALGIKQSTVSHWAKTGTVPARWHSKIIQAAADQGLTVEAGDLVLDPDPDQGPAVPGADRHRWQGADGRRCQRRVVLNLLLRPERRAARDLAHQRARSPGQVR